MHDPEQVFPRLSFFDKEKSNAEFYNWVDQNGKHWDDPVAYLQSDLLNFCGCGDPEANLEYVMNGLAHIDELYDTVAFASYEEWQQRGHQVFGSKESRYFFFYWADTQDLTEHGGSVPGWLTEKGNALLSDLRLLKEAGFLDE